MSGPSLLEIPLAFEPYVYPCGEEIVLPISGSIPERDFLDVLKNRRSIKTLNTCSLEDLSRILYYSLKPYTIAMDNLGAIVYRSASPSAGGRHPIDVLVSIIQNENRFLFLYNPLIHSLRKLHIPLDVQKRFYTDVENTLLLGNSVLLWFSIQFMRTASKYSDPMSLIWRDVGAQICCIQQVAEFFNVGSCPIGYLAQDSFIRMFDETDKLLSGGGMIIGGKSIMK